MKKALLVGCNYPHMGWYQLYGCYNDVNIAHETLTNVYGFDRHNIKVLTDEPGSREMPTGKNIMSSLKDLISEIGEGGILFFHFSGHGTQFPFDTKDKIEEAIVPSDGNCITKMDFRILVNSLPRDATFVFFADCCHSGGLFDQKKEQIGPNTWSRNGERQLENCRTVPYETVLALLNETASSSRGRDNKLITDFKTVMLDKFGSDASLLFKGTRGLPQPLQFNQGILLSACQSDELAYEYECNNKGDCYGVFTLAVHIIIKEKLLFESFSNKQLVMKAREIAPKLRKYPKQHPCLYCSDDNVHGIFLSKAKMGDSSLGEGSEDISQSNETNGSLFDTVVADPVRLTKIFPKYLVRLTKRFPKFLISYLFRIIFLIVLVRLLGEGSEDILHSDEKNWSSFNTMIAYAVWLLKIFSKHNLFIELVMNLCILYSLDFLINHMHM